MGCTCSFCLSRHLRYECGSLGQTHSWCGDHLSTKLQPQPGIGNLISILTIGENLRFMVLGNRRFINNPWDSFQCQHNIQNCSLLEIRNVWVHIWWLHFPPSGCILTHDDSVPEKPGGRRRTEALRIRIYFHVLLNSHGMRILTALWDCSPSRSILSLHGEDYIRSQNIINDDKLMFTMGVICRPDRNNFHEKFCQHSPG